MLVGYLISTSLVLDFWPSVALGVILAIAAKVLSIWEERASEPAEPTEDN